MSAVYPPIEEKGGYPVQPPTAPEYPLQAPPTGYPAQQYTGYPPQQPTGWTSPTAYTAPPIGGHPSQPATSGYPPQSYPPTSAQTHTTYVVAAQTGNCPSCHRGNLVEGFSLCGIIWAICCFPCGLICCLTMKDKKCGQCGYHN